jgi:hypothetical protein
VRIGKCLFAGSAVALLLGGCIVIQQPPQEPTVAAPLVSSYTANDIAACDGLVDAVNAAAANPADFNAAKAAILTIATLINQRANLADDGDLVFALSTSASTIATVYDEANQNGQVSGSSQLAFRNAIDSASEACEGVR